MKNLLLLMAFQLLFFTPFSVHAASVATGAAPQGDAKTVATRIIKYNFPQCKRVTKASRLPDGAIRATCDTTDYLVFTLYDAKAGKMHEVAMNCEATKQLLGIPCPGR
jgi:hypothetical protein